MYLDLQGSNYFILIVLYIHLSQTENKCVLCVGLNKTYFSLHCNYFMFYYLYLQLLYFEYYVNKIANIFSIYESNLQNRKIYLFYIIFHYILVKKSVNVLAFCKYCNIILIINTRKTLMIKFKAQIMSNYRSYIKKIHKIIIHSRYIKIIKFLIRSYFQFVGINILIKINSHFPYAS